METMNTTTSEEKAVALAALNPRDEVLVKTRSSDYRIMLLDPKTGRALVQGGRYLGQPVEVTVTGSTIRGIKLASIDVGCRMEIKLDGKRLSTSPIQSLKIARASNPDLVTGNN
jgi:hypothetical protein